MSDLGQWLAGIYIARRNAYAMVMAIGLGGLLVWALWSWPAERVSLQQLSAEVLSITPAQATSPTTKGRPMTVIVVRIPDGRRVRLMLDANTRPPLGSKVPVTYERYADDSETFFFNRQRWLEEGG